MRVSINKLYPIDASGDEEVVLSHNNIHAAISIYYRFTGPTLWSFRVIPESQRGKGYGSILMNYVVQHLKSQGFDKVSLRVESHNVKAIALYERMGFVIKKLDYRSIHDAVLHLSDYKEYVPTKFKRIRRHARFVASNSSDFTNYRLD